MNDFLKISIITIVYNNKEHIDDCINSVLNQNYSNVEYIIIDGGSTDGTVDIIKKHGELVSVFVTEPDLGLYDALNKGIALATGDVIGILHSDDIFINEKVLSDVVSTIDETDVDLVYGKGVFVDRNNVNQIRRVYSGSIFHNWMLFFGWIPLHTTIFVKNEVFAKHGLYDLKYSIASDYDLSLKWFLDKNLKKTFLDQYIVKMRLGGKSTSIDLQRTKSLQDLAIIRKYHLWGVITLFFKLVRKVPQYLKPYFINSDFN